MKFRGNFPAKIDSQGRLKIPTAHRLILEQTYGPDVWVTSENGDCVKIYPMSVWEDMESQLDGMREYPEKTQYLLHVNYFGQPASMDKQGRIVIQPHLRDSAEVDAEEVAVIGQINHLVVWNNERIKGILKASPVTPEVFGRLADKMTEKRI